MSNVTVRPIAVDQVVVVVVAAMIVLIAAVSLTAHQVALHLDLLQQLKN